MKVLIAGFSGALMRLPIAACAPARGGSHHGSGRHRSDGHRSSDGRSNSYGGYLRSSSSIVHVHGYTTKRGSYVHRYDRTAPDQRRQLLSVTVRGTQSCG